MKKKLLTAAALSALFFGSVLMYSCNKSNAETKAYPKALANYGDFKNLVSVIEQHRQERLVSLDDFLKMQKEPNTVLLDTRSANRYAGRHLKGALSLPFTDFTQTNLKRLIPDANTRILIYCNNNFQGDQVNFTTKTATPSAANNHTPLTLALNIPTYINLFGYGYKNVYELDELVNVSDSRIQFEGAAQ
ncbi:rhodanese-like domain-containing protein [Niabella drilacis]|uniref:Rhodanese-like domain-containing protein n=1 Tax=Niabella drilacis (strain DSM 25811 / CCM 8410 / CCUG 62505 / LMG 26954 / E90) TaxID=1285928 RepID=A0A1G6NHQ0_NIADE|nr:rhodanese-like domain-containing protein [Niabella drilacis]SDC67470.1 Rhodanese-like domain-containing protein [Niabella drilacis]